MQYTKNEISMLNKANEIGLTVDTLPEAEDYIFALLSPFMDQLMELLKRLKPYEMDELFFKYRGIMNIMKLLEESAQRIEAELYSR